jgi:hypothetical protein
MKDQHRSKGGVFFEELFSAFNFYSPRNDTESTVKSTVTIV